MPELPEVQTVVNDLARLIPLGSRVLSFEAFRPDLRFAIPDALAAELSGQILRGLHRRSKYILFEFESARLLSHLGMTGAWRVVEGTNLDISEDASAKPRALDDPTASARDQGASFRLHDHLRVTWLTPTQSVLHLIYNDPRRFGYVDWIRSNEPNAFLDRLGPEPLSDAFTGEYLHRITRTKTASIKAFLMDAKNVVGIGNIYASEILFQARVRPSRRAKLITLKDAQSIVASTKAVLSQAILMGGSTIRDYTSATGTSGSYQDAHLVYGREGLLCLVCHEKFIRSRVIAGRSTFWCPNCQTS